MLQGSKFLSFRVDPFFKMEANNFDSRASPENTPIPFKKSENKTSGFDL